MTPSQSSALDELLAFVRANGRVCPQPNKWSELWQMLPQRQRVGSGWQPPSPLILAAWWEASDEQKRDRLANHIQYAAEHSFLMEIDQFLRQLSDGEWSCKD